MEIDVSGLSSEPGHPWLMDEDSRVGKSEALFGCAAGEEQRGDGGRLANAGGDDVGLDELHGVVNGEARRDGATRRIDVELNVLFRIFSLKKQHLRGGQIGNVVINRRANKNDVFLEEPGVNVVGALTAAGLFDHHGYESCPAIFRFFEVFHWDDGPGPVGVIRSALRASADRVYFASAAATVL